MLEWPAHQKSLRQIFWNLDIIQELRVALGVIKDNHVHFHRVPTVRSHNSLRMQFQRVPPDLFHHVVNKQVPVKLFLQYQNLVLYQNAVVVVKGHNFVVIRQHH